MPLDLYVEQRKKRADEGHFEAIKAELECSKHRLLNDIRIVPKAAHYTRNNVNYRLISLVEACDNFYYITRNLPSWCIIAVNDGKIQYCAENFIIIQGQHYGRQNKVGYMAVTPDSSSDGNLKDVLRHELPQLISEGKYKWFKCDRDTSNDTPKQIIEEAEKMADDESDSEIRYEYRGVWFDRRHNDNKTFPDGHFFNPTTIPNYQSNSTYYLFKACKEGSFEAACNRSWSIGTQLDITVWGTPAPWYKIYAKNELEKKRNYDWYKKKDIKFVLIFQKGNDETTEIKNRRIEYKVIPIRDFNLPTLSNLAEALTALRERPIHTSAAMHCTAGAGRTGYMIMCLKKLLSPIDGLTFNDVLITVGAEYRWGAKDEISVEDSAEIQFDGEITNLKESRKKFNDKHLQDKIQRSGGVCQYKYFRFVGGTISSTPDAHFALKGLGSWNFVEEEGKHGTTWNIILSLPGGETLEALYFMYEDEGCDTWNSGTAKGLRKFIKRRNKKNNYWECVLPCWVPSTKMIAHVKDVSNGLPWS